MAKESAGDADSCRSVRAPAHASDAQFDARAHEQQLPTAETLTPMKAHAADLQIGKNVGWAGLICDVLAAIASAVATRVALRPGIFAALAGETPINDRGQS